MDLINHSSLGLDNAVCKVAIQKLTNEGLIADANIVHGGNDTIPIYVRAKYLQMTRYGIDYIEQKIGIDPVSSGEQKVKKVMENTARWGWDQFKDFGARVIAEMLKQ